MFWRGHATSMTPGHAPPDVGVLAAKSEGAKFRQARLSVSPNFDSVSQVSVLSRALNTLGYPISWSRLFGIRIYSLDCRPSTETQLSRPFCAQVKSYLLFIISSSSTKGALTLGNRAAHKHSCPLKSRTDGSGVLEQRFQPWFLQTTNTFSHLLLGHLMHISVK